MTPGVLNHETASWGTCAAAFVGLPGRRHVRALPNAVRMEPAVYPLSGLNGPYDDFNAVAGPPPLFMDAFIAFASNDASGGGQFTVDAGRLTVLQNPLPRSPPSPGRPRRS